mgnify:CR=1 FL=1
MSDYLKAGENCGGPLICKACAMKLSNKFYFAGKKEWAEIYRDHAKKLIDDKNKEKLNGKSGDNL